MKRFGTLFAIFCVWYTTALAGEPVQATQPATGKPVILKADTDSLQLGPYLYFLEDKNKTFDVDTVRSEEYVWKKSDKVIPSFGFTTSVYWLGFTLQNDSANQEWYLEVAYPMHDNIRMYIQKENSIGSPVYEVMEQGDQFSFSRRKFSYRNFLFPVNIREGETKTCYIRFETASSMDLPLILWQPQAFNNFISSEQMLMGIYFGAMLIMLLYNIFLFFGIKNINYLYYILFIFFYTFFQATLNGYAFQYLWPDWIWWANICLPIFISMGTLWCLIFNRNYLNTKVNTPVFDKIMLVLIGLCIASSLTSLFLAYSISIRVATFLNILSFTVILINSCVSLVKGYRTARIYAIAWTVFLLGTIIFALKSFGLVPNNPLTGWSGMIGSLMLVILLSLALTDQMNVIRQEKTEALTRLNEAYSRFVPLEFLQLLEKKSILDIKLGDQIQREITILFSDIRSFTTLSESMTPEENFNFLNSYLSRISPIIRKYNGFIDKYIGDAIMALFPGSSLDAVNASIEIRKELWDFNRVRYDQKLAPIEIGIGLHCGTVMLGTIGEERRIDGTVIADTVNLASRLEGITKLFGSAIIISKDIYEKLQGPESYKCRYLGKIKLKGKNIATEIYEVIEGFSERVSQIKMSTIQDFEKGLNLYHARQFPESLIIFKKIIKKDPKDKAAQYYHRIIKKQINVPEKIR